MAELSAAQREILLSLPDRISIERLNRIWIFPPHQGKSRETGLFVFGLRVDEGGSDGLQALDTLRYQAETEKGKLKLEIDFAEEGWAPPDRIDRVIEGALARSGDDLGEPIEGVIDGDEEKWLELLESFRISLDPANQ